MTDIFQPDGQSFRKNNPKLLIKSVKFYIIEAYKKYCMKPEMP